MTRILYIEDEASYREATAYMLQKEGFDVAQAEDGVSGLAEYDRNGADLVLLDLMMPGMAGTEVCRELRQRGGVPVIMVGRPPIPDGVQLAAEPRAVHGWLAEQLNPDQDRPLLR